MPPTDVNQTGRGGDQGECKPRIDVIVKMQKKNKSRGGRVGVRSGAGVRVDVNQELKLL